MPVQLWNFGNLDLLTLFLWIYHSFFIKYNYNDWTLKQMFWYVFTISSIIWQFADFPLVHIQVCLPGNRLHTTVKNARNRKSVSRGKLPYFEGIFKLWTPDQQDLPFLQMFIIFVKQNLPVLCLKRPWNGFHFSWNFWCCLNSIQKVNVC